LPIFIEIPPLGRDTSRYAKLALTDNGRTDGPPDNLLPPPPYCLRRGGKITLTKCSYNNLLLLIIIRMRSSFCNQ